MGISLIPNQQFIFDEQIQPCNNADKRSYCQLLQDFDFLYFQFKETPCGANLLCNPTFSPTEGAELLTNGTFAGSAAGWTLGTGWAYGTNNVVKTAGSASELLQSGLTLDAAKVYTLSFTFSGITTGLLSVYIGDSLLGTIDSNGDYSFQGSPNVVLDRVRFSASNTFDGTIDDVSLKEVTLNCWTFSNANITLGTDGVCHLTGAATDLVQSAVLINTLFYRFQITISGRTGGTVEIYAGTVLVGTADANGLQTFYGTSDGADITLTMSSDFDGCINLMDQRLMREDFQVILKDLDDNIVANLSDSFFSVDNDSTNEYFTARLEMVGITDINGDPLPYGCYKVCFYDPCLTSIENDNIWETIISWTPSDPDIIHSTVTNEDGWFMTATGNGDGSAAITTSSGSALPFSNWTDGEMQMLMYVDFVTGIIENITNRVYIYLPNAGIISQTLIATNVQPNTRYTFHFLINVDNTGIFQDKMKITCEFDGVTTGDENQIRYLAVTAIPLTNRSPQFFVSQREFCSNCFSWQAEQECTSIFLAESNSDYKSGFYFGNGFLLQNRLRLLPIAPTNLQDEDDYLFSDGTRSITYSSTEEYYVVWFDYVDRITHSNINVIINSDAPSIDGIAYYFKKGNYSPDWDKDYRFKLAQSRVEAKIKDRTIFNTNCG